VGDTSGGQVRIHIVKHVPFEGPARIAEWAGERGHVMTESLALLEAHPKPEDFDMLVVMGGPMAADNHAEHPWLEAEKRFVAEAVEADRVVLGVCLGAQVIAAALGAKVRRNPEKEIGWFPVARTPAGAADPVFSVFPQELVVGQWHGDTFEVPSGAVLTASSAACANQAFTLRGGRVVGLQFHLEWDGTTLAALLEACGNELAEQGTHVAAASEIADGAAEYLPGCARALRELLDAMTEATG
jgi:GMP synthase-like glutamine amidotransferase